MRSLQNCTVAVTGGCGFIGSHLIEKLRGCGARVLAIDSLAYGRRENLDISDPATASNSLRLRSGSGAQCLQNLLKGVDYVFHLAVQVEKHNQLIHSPGRLLDSNVMGSNRTVQGAADAGVKKVVFTSSLYAYGVLTGPPLSEDEVPVPHTVYGISKLSGEHYCRYFFARHGLRAICLRLFFVYGPRQYAGQGYKSVIVKNFERMLNGQTPIINGDGKQELDYIYVDDVVSSLLLAMTGDDAFDVFNVGSGSGATVNHLTALMVKVAGVKTAPESGPPDFTNGSSRVANTKKFDARFGPQPRVPLEEGLRRTFEWMTSSQRQ